MSNNIDSSKLFKYSAFVNNDSKSGKNDTESLQEKAPSQENDVKFEELSQEKIFDYMKMCGDYNKQAANVSAYKISAENINPSDYLSADRIRDIEISMSRFDELYEKAYNIIDSEIGNTVSEAAKRNLAALYLM